MSEHDKPNPLCAIHAACGAIQWMAGRLEHARLFFGISRPKDDHGREVFDEISREHKQALSAVAAAMSAPMLWIADYQDGRDAFGVDDADVTDGAFMYMRRMLEEISPGDKLLAVEILREAANSLERAALTASELRPVPEGGRVELNRERGEG